MAGKLKGLDQITAWIGGIALSATLLTIVWYGTKYYTGTHESEEQTKMAALLDEINQPKEPPEDEGAELRPQHTPESDHATNKPKSHSSLENYGYTGNLAPWYWSNLNDKWHQCAAKTDQSPIDLSGAKVDERLKTLKVFYLHGTANISFEHQTVQAEVQRGSYIEWEGERFDLMRAYFRTPSEHRVNSMPFEMEVQLEHESVDGKKIMMAVLLASGKANNIVESMAQNIPKLPNDTKEVERINWSDLLPQKRTYWTYLGSATTPPCNTGVRWLVFTQEVTTSKSSIDRFVLKQKTNVRPVFDLGKRTLSRSNR